MKRPLAALLIVAQVSLVACHNTIDGVGGSTQQSGLIAGLLGSNDLGAAVFQIYRNRLQTEPDTTIRAAEVAALDANKAQFIQAVNDIINTSSVGGGVTTAQDLFKLVDDGTIPRLSQDVASMLDLLQQDPQAEQAIITLLQTATAASTAKNSQIPLDQLIALLARIDNYPQVAQVWGAAADIISQKPQLVTNLLSFGSKELQAAQVSTGSSILGNVVTGLKDSLLEPAQVRSGQSFGAPAWVVRLDSRGLPQVATDPSTGKLVAPFVDSGNGLAAVNASNDFIDASGNPINLPAFGTPNTAGYDANGLAITASGIDAYVYFDAKQTTLALELKLGGDILRQNADVHALKVLAAALGPQQPDGSYLDGPLPDVVYGGLELLDQNDTPPLLSALATLLQNNPGQAEQLLCSVSRAVDAIKQAQAASAQAGGLGSVGLSDPRMVQLTDALLPLVDQIFTVPAAGGPSTARVIFDVLNDLNTQVPGWPKQLAPLATMHQINPPIAVDYTKAAFYVDASGNTVDNRSATHELLDLLAKADQCSIPFTSQTLADLILSMMASLSPSTVSTLTSLITSVPGFLINLVCPNLANDIPALQALADSGSLDALLPICKAFKDKGEIPLLVKILVLVDGQYGSVFRQSEPDSNLILSSGAVDQICGLIGESTQITDPVSGMRLADIIADSIANLVNQHSSSVIDRHGSHVPSLAYLLLIPARTLDARFTAAGVSGDLTSLGDTFVQVVLARTTNTLTGQDQLANGCIVPFMTKLLSVAASTVPVDPAQRRSLVTSAETSATTFLVSKDMGALVNLEQTIQASSSFSVIEAATVNLLTPNQSTPDDIFGAICQLAAIELQTWVSTASTVTPATSQAFVDLEHYLGQAIDPSRPSIQDLVAGITKVIVADQGMTLLGVQRAAFNIAPDSGKAPIVVLIRIFQAVSDARNKASGVGPGAPISLTDLQNGIQQVLTAIRDPNGVVSQLFTVIEHRQK